MSQYSQLLVPTCLTLFLELLTRNMPRVWRPKFSRWRKQACAIWGMLGSLSAMLMSAVDPQDRLSSRPGTLPAIRSPGDIRLSYDPLWTHRRSNSQVLSAEKSTVLTIKAQWLLYVPEGLTLRNSTFFPQNAFNVLNGPQNRDYFHTQFQQVGFHNGGVVCLLRDMTWLFQWFAS